jgi:aryl-alcohol dehydrogenase-like predicted oxidoreductase
MTTPEFCIKYVLGSEAVSAVIPGSANPEHVRANASVSSVPALNDSLRRQVKDLWLNREIHGTYAGSD